MREIPASDSQSTDRRGPGYLKTKLNLIEKHLRDFPRERFSALRTAGYTLYCAWVLASFYCTFLYTSALDYREALYLHMFVSLVALAFIIFLVSRFLKRADKWVLSKWVIYSSAGVMCASTFAFSFFDSQSTPGFILIIIFALLTGFSSGVLFLGWGRLFADAGTRIALIETALSWCIGAIICLILTFLPSIASIVIVILIGITSGHLLRLCALQRPSRPAPLRRHNLHPRTKHMLTRGFFAAVNFGFVAGFADVISGFRFFSVSDEYGVLLLTGLCGISLVAAIITALARHDITTYVYRLAFITLVFGCLSIPFMYNNMTYPNIIILGGYICFHIVLLVIAIDISNYFDISAVKAVGYAFTALYVGEVLGSGIGHYVSTLPSDPFALSLIAFFLVGALIFSNIFLFTEKDLTETRLGEMVDSDSEKTEMSAIAEAETESMDAICLFLTSTYGLTAREADVLPLVLRGRTIARIQEELFISAGTVSTHVRHIYQKIGVKNRQALLDLVDTQTNGMKDAVASEASSPAANENTSVESTQKTPIVSEASSNKAKQSAGEKKKVKRKTERA